MNNYIIYISKRRNPDDLHAIWYRHACKAAFAERTDLYARHAVGYRHILKPFAVPKRQAPNVRHAGGYCHARNPAAARGSGTG